MRPQKCVHLERLARRAGRLADQMNHRAAFADVAVQLFEQRAASHGKVCLLRHLPRHIRTTQVGTQHLPAAPKLGRRRTQIKLTE